MYTALSYYCNADFQLQQMERKVARAQGNYRADEKEALNAKVCVCVCVCVCV